LGAAAVAGAAIGSSYYANGDYSASGNIAYGSGGYDSYASANYDTSGGDTYLLHGNYISESDAIAYCAQHLRSYDAASRTFVTYSGERTS
jgi:hypothetical protein